MWKRLWERIMGRGKKNKLPPVIEPAPTPAPAPAPAPAPTPTPAPAPVPPDSTDFATLQSRGYLPYYANVPDPSDYPTAPTTYNLQPGMPTTGGRDDLAKLLPGWQVRALLNGTSSNAWKQTLLNADAEKLFPWHIDDASGSPWNIDNNPNVTLDTRFPGVPIGDPNWGSLPGIIDAEHMPQLTYPPFLMATDPVEKERWLRALQRQATWLMTRHGTNNGLGFVGVEQVRGWAHAMPILAMTAHATRLWESLGLTPSRPLLSANYFDRKLENNNRRLDAITINAGPHLVGGVLMPAFHIYPPLQIKEYALWMNDMAAVGDGVQVRLGFAKARPRFQWAIQGIKDRLKTGNDWGRVYKVNFQNEPNPVVLTWPELWANRIEADPSLDFSHHTHGALCLAASLGDAEAAEMAQSLRAKGFLYSEIGYFFDPAPRPVALTQPIVDADPQYAAATISMLWN